MPLGIFKRFKPQLAKNPASEDLQAKFERALSLNKEGLFAEATAVCREIIELAPRHIETLMLLAEITASKDEPEKAIELYDKIIDLRPDLSTAYYKRGNLQIDRSQLEAALEDYDQAIALNPVYANAFCNRGVVMARLNRLDEALDSYQQAIALNPNDALAYFNRGAVLRELKRPQEALTSYNQAIAVKPDYLQCHFNRSLLLAELKQWDAALASYDQSIKLSPGFFQAHFNRGALLHERKQWVGALASYDRAIEINSEYAEAYCGRGVLLTQLRQFDAALADLDRAIALKPEYPDAFHDRANTLFYMKRFAAAVASYDKAIEFKPDFAAAFTGRGLSLLNLRQFEVAIESFNRALMLDADQRYLLGMRRHAQMQICDWEDLAPDLDRLTEGLKARIPVATPHTVLALVDSPPLHRLAAEIWVREECPTDDALGAIPPRPRGDKIRIGYFSADFRDHAVSLLTAGLFEIHNRSRFEVTAFAFGPGASGTVRERLERAFDRFIDVRDQSDIEVALLARTAGIDIAVDLGGFTENARAKIFSLRAAPIQVGYLGYLGTMGAPYMDYLIADAAIIPVVEQENYSEKIIYLPSYQVNDRQRRMAEHMFTREQLGLPAVGFVFCCFNANYKIMPATFEVWMRILKRVEGSILFLYADNEIAERNLLGAARRSGVESHRIVFGKRVALEEYLARFRAMDLFLDTLPYNAGTTASDALWAGVPVLTCTGEAFAGRVAASLLKAIDLPELITATSAQYEDVAVRLATNPVLFAQIRQKLAHNRLTTPLFDTGLFTKTLESAYVQIYERYHANLPTEHVYSQ
jgi:protein O-GlcNAc transferase